MIGSKPARLCATLMFRFFWLNSSLALVKMAISPSVTPRFDAASSARSRPLALGTSVG